jgi:hypothetical protein
MPHLSRSSPVSGEPYARGLIPEAPDFPREIWALRPGPRGVSSRDDVTKPTRAEGAVRRGRLDSAGTLRLQ